MIKQIFKLWYSGSKYNLAPLAIAGITAGLSGLGNALFGSDKKEYTIDDLVKYGYKPYDADKERGDLQRILSARRKSRRQGIKGKNFQSGRNNPTDIHTNEEDITQAEVLGQSDIQRKQREENNRIAQILFNMNEQQPEDQGFGLDFIEGALEGLPIGLEAERLLKLSELPNDDNPKNDTQKSKDYPYTEPRDHLEGREDLAFLQGMSSKDFEKYLNYKLGLV